ALLLAEEHLPAARAAAEPALAGAMRLHYASGARDYAARLFIHVAIAAQVAGVVENHLLADAARGRQTRSQPRQQFAVMLDLKRSADLAPIRADGAHAMRTDGHHLLDVGCPQRFDI